MSETTQTSSPASISKRITIKEFIDENDKLFTAIGVMGALAALFTTLKNAEVLSLLSFILLLILDWQLIMVFPKMRDSSASLVFFEVFSQAFFGTIGAYIFQQYPKYLFLIIPSSSGLVVAGGFILLRRKYSRKISMLVAGVIFAFLMVVYFIALSFHLL